MVSFSGKIVISWLIWKKSHEIHGVLLIFGAFLGIWKNIKLYCTDKWIFISKNDVILSPIWMQQQQHAHQHNDNNQRQQSVMHSTKFTHTHMPHR